MTSMQSDDDNVGKIPLLTRLGILGLASSLARTGPITDHHHVTPVRRVVLDRSPGYSLPRTKGNTR